MAANIYSVITDFTSWSSANTSVATIASTTANVTGVGIGSAVQSSPGYVSWGGADVKTCHLRLFTPSGPANINNLTPVQHNYPGNPLPNACWISQVFDHIGANGKAHHAEDVTSSTGNGTHSSPAYGTSIYAMEGGKITKLDGSQDPASPPFPACQGLNKLANTVWILGSDGYTTRYVHITPAPGLTVGQNVTQGQLIGTLDNSGCQKGAHLHVGRYPPSGPAVNFTIPCVNQTPVTQLWDGSVDDDDTAITP